MKANEIKVAFQMASSMLQDGGLNLDESELDARMDKACVSNDKKNDIIYLADAICNFGSFFEQKSEKKN